MYIETSAAVYSMKIFNLDSMNLKYLYPLNFRISAIET